MKQYKELMNEGLRGENFYYEWDLMNKTENDAITAVLGQGFEKYGESSYRNRLTKELADIRHTSKGYKIDISDSHGKRLA